MRSLYAVILVVVMAVGLAACGQTEVNSVSLKVGVTDKKLTTWHDYQQYFDKGESYADYRRRMYRGSVVRLPRGIVQASFCKHEGKRMQVYIPAQESNLREKTQVFADKRCPPL